MSGIFTLGQVGRRQDSGTWDTVSNVFLTEKLEPVLGNYGYIAGGYDKNHIWRIDFANDTNLCPARSTLLVLSQWQVDGCSSKDYGYFAGGNQSPDQHRTTVQRLDYANDTAQCIARTHLTSNSTQWSTTHTKDYGYWQAGDVINRTDFSNDTAAALDRADCSVSRANAMGFGNMAYGYFSGGGELSSIDRFDYASDTTNAVAKSNLTQGNKDAGASSNSAYGYIAGGQNVSPGHTSTVDRLDFSSDTTNCVAKGPLTAAKRHVGSTGNSIAGYHGGASPGNSVLERIDYFNDTADAILKGNLPGGTWGCGGTGNRTKGLPDFSTNYSAAVPYGYFAGGDEPGAPGQVSKIDRLDFDNDTATMLHKGNLIGNLEQCSAWSTLNHFYSTNGNGNKVLRLSYMNDTATTSERGTFTSTGLGRAGVMQNTNYAYLYGGPNPSGISTIQRIDFANDGGGSVPRGPLTGGIYAAGGHSNQSYGYSMGGYVPFASPARKSWVQRLDFANDTATAPVRGNLPEEYSSGTGSSTLAYGYHSGGTGSTHGGTLVYRIDFSTDTTAASPKGPLAGGNGGYAGSTSNDTSYGYWAGGNPGTSKVHRLDFTNDSSTGTEKGPLSAGRRWVWEGASSSKEAVLSGLTSFQYDYTHAIPATVSETTVDSGKTQSYVTGGLTWDYSPLNELSISPGYGYVMAGATPGGQVSTIDRIDFGNDTATALVKGNLADASRRVAALSSLNYGYKLGGLDGPGSNATTDTERLDYANDTGTLGFAGHLSLARNYAAGLSNTDYGYMGGGSDPSGKFTTVDRLDFSSDVTTFVAKGPLTLGRDALTAIMSADYGYFAGGTKAGSPAVGAAVSTVDRIDFSSDTTACVTKGPLSIPHGGCSAGTNNADFGYVGSGVDGSGDTSSVDKISFSNDTATTVLKGPLTTATDYKAATGNALYGYFAGGDGSPDLTTVDRIDYSNDTVAATAKGPLTVGRDSHAATSNRVLPLHRILKGLNNTFSEVQGTLTSNTTGYAYWGGGYPANTTVDRVDYSNDTATALLRGSTTSARYKLAGTGNQNYGYFGGGVTGPGATVSTLDRLDYSSDSSVMASKGPLSVVRKGQNVATGNLSYGYWCGGQTPSTSSEVDRVDYGNDTATATPKGPLSLKRSGPGSTGTQSYGYIGGGEPGPSRTSTIDRVDYSNDTATGLSKGPLTVARDNMGAAGNANYGWWGGGTTGSDSSVVDRLDYSSDTTCVAKGPLTTARWQLSASSNTSHGYFGGGYESSTTVTKVDRVDFSSDTATASPKGSLTGTAHRFPGSFSPQDCGFPQSYTSTVAYSNATSFGGYLGGGLYRKSNIERMDYSNDGVDPINKANFPRGLESNNGAVSSLISGYWCGGETNPNPTESSTINRIDYANDTNVMTVGNKTAGSKANGAFGNKNYGYCGGQPMTTMERLDYANDLAGMLGRSTGNPTINERGCTASAGYGYYNSTGSKVDRLDFANDTVAASQRTSLTYAIGSRSSAVGNADYGWWFGSGPTTVGRVDYSSDTVTATVRGYLQTTSPLSANYASGHGNENYGYVQGYYNTNIQRIDYANDMATPIIRGQSKAYLGGAMSAGTSCRENSLSLHTIGQTTKDWQSAFAAPVQVVPSSQSAYWIGGAPADGRLIQRLIIASDTIKATAPGGSTTASMSDTRSGVGNRNYGYLDMTSSTTNIERLDYANDTSTTTTHLFAAEARQQRGGTSTENYGYIAGGSPSNSFIDRIDFNSDTTTALARGPLAAATTHCRGVGNASYGYFGTGSITNVQRLDYSSDTDAAILKADGLSGWGANATGNASYGYWGGGGPGSSRTDVRRLDYSSDTTTLAPKGPLSAGRSEHATATGNISYGYWAGGEPSSTNDTNISRIDYSNDTATALGRGPLATRIQNANKLSGGHDALPQ